jgi:hypothetical protein
MGAIGFGLRRRGEPIPGEWTESAYVQSYRNVEAKSWPNASRHVLVGNDRCGLINFLLNKLHNYAILQRQRLGTEWRAGCWLEGNG